MGFYNTHLNEWFVAVAFGLITEETGLINTVHLSMPNELLFTIAIF